MDGYADMNISWLNSFVTQDNYLEEAMKMRNLLEEFHGSHGLRPPTILGVREHVFTGRFGIHQLKFKNKMMQMYFCCSVVLLTDCVLDTSAVSHPWPGSCLIKKLAL